jgi:hypothetical protein
MIILYTHGIEEIYIVSGIELENITDELTIRLFE